MFHNGKTKEENGSMEAKSNLNWERVSLINSCLTMIPLFFLSFYKAPKLVVDNIKAMQDNFLWGGNPEQRTVVWVSWDNICQPKVNEGLGLKNVELFNKALIVKWKWRQLEKEKTMWAKILIAKYGPVRDMRTILSSTSISKWLSDVLSMTEADNVNDLFEQ